MTARLLSLQIPQFLVLTCCFFFKLRLINESRNTIQIELEKVDIMNEWVGCFVTGLLQKRSIHISLQFNLLIFLFIFQVYDQDLQHVLEILKQYTISDDTCDESR